MKIEIFDKRKRDMKNTILYGITVAADIALITAILTIDTLSASIGWWAAVVLSMMWIIVFGYVNRDRW